MKKYRLFPAICLAAALLLSACSQDEPAENNTALPEGEYPLQIGSVTLTAEVSEQPWTRVSENLTNGMSSEFQPDDAIGVSLNGETATYTYDGTAWTSEAPLYWKDKNYATVSAWYPVDEKNYATVSAWYPVDETIDFTHQDQGLTYLLKADGVEAGFDKPANLTFTHQLAKVRVKLEGAKANEVTAVTVRSYPKATHNQGTNVTKEGDAAYYPMRKAIYDGENYWEANLLKGYLDADNTFRVSKDGNSFVQVTLDADVPITVGQIHTITINVEQAPTEINLDTYEDPTLAVSGKTILKGNGQQKNLQVTVEADAEVTLENVVLQPSALGNAITCKGDATIILTGSSSLTAKSNFFNGNYGSGIYVERGTLTINGDGSLNISREYVDGSMNVGAGIGAAGEANIVIENGDISIGEVPEKSGISGAGIGSLYDESCGDITINGGTISIGQPSWYSACIGSAQHGSCGNITISGESTVITFTKGELAPCGIGNGGERGTCGTVTITDGATLNGKKYYDHTGTL